MGPASFWKHVNGNIVRASDRKPNLFPRQTETKIDRQTPLSRRTCLTPHTCETIVRTSEDVGDLPFGIRTVGITSFLCGILNLLHTLYNNAPQLPFVC